MGSNGEDSLELLLDTITNAFGGIVFLAILVVILLRNSSTTAMPPTEQVDPLSLATELQELEAAIAPLETQWRALQTIADSLADPQLRVTLDELRRLREQRETLDSKKYQLLQAIAASQGAIQTAVQQSQQLDASLQEERRKIEEAQLLLDEERASRTVNSPFPEERQSSKRPYNITIRYGRWYVDWFQDGSPNLRDFAVLDSGGAYLTVTPKPYRGTSMNRAGELAPEIVKQLESKSPSSDYVDISIWDDSFAQFQLLRDYLVSRGFQYRLVPVTDGNEVRYGPVTDARVQ